MSIRTLGLATAAAAGLALSVPALAQDFTVGVGTVVAVPGNNDFKANLAGIGLVDYTDVGSSVSLSGPAILKFEFVAREAGFDNTFITKDFSWTSVSPPSLVPWDAALPIGSGFYAGGSITDWLFERGGPAPGAQFGIGTQQFAIFLPTGFTTGQSWTSKVLYLGFDDTGAGPDDNHDDMIIRVTAMAVPEPATWAMLIAGFGLVGFSLRRRQTTEHVSA
jgi:hypothetical protein